MFARNNRSKTPPGIIVMQSEYGLTLWISGRPVDATPGTVALLDCLHKNIGCVVSYAQLSLAVMCKSADAARRRRVLCQFAHSANRVLALHQAPYVIMPAKNLGYALCEIGRPRRLNGRQR